MDKNLRNRIKEVAVKHFNTNGYHGTTIRNIARDVDCSLPMIYYYYKSKKDLFDEIITKDYLQLIISRRLDMSLHMGNIIEFYTKLIFTLNDLSSYEKQIYRLGIKVYITFDGDEEHIQVLDEFEKSVFTQHAEIIMPHMPNSAESAKVVRTLMHLLDSLIIEIIVKGSYLPEEEIRDEISIILDRYI